MKRLFTILVAAVMAVCGLRAQCSPMQLPYRADFSDVMGGWLPSCWLRADADSTVLVDHLAHVAYGVGYDDDGALLMLASADGVDYGVAMPPVESAAGFVELSFWAASFSADAPVAATLTVALMADGDSLAPGVPVAAMTLPADGHYRHYRCRLPIADSGLWRPRFEVTSGYGCYVDRVLVAQGTECAAGPMQLPYFASFQPSQTDRLPGCWLSSASDGQAAYDLPAVVVAEGYDDSLCLRIAASPSGANNGVALPPADPASGFIEVSFWAASWADVAGLPATLAVGLMADADTMGPIAVQEQALLPADGQYHRYNIHMVMPDSGLWRPAFEVVSGCGCFIDQIMVFEGASCQSPQGLTLDWVDSSSAHIVWQPAADSCQWLVRVGGDDAIEQDSTDLLIAGLEPDANTHVEVRAICRAGDTTDAAVLDFRTMCGMQQMPLYEDFNSYFDGDDPHCWTVIGRWSHYQTSAPYVQTAVPGVEAEYVMVSANDSTPVGLVSPTMAPTTDRLHAMFSLQFGGPGTFVAGLMRHPDSAFVPVLTIENASLDVAGQQPWYDYEFYTDTVVSVGLDEPYYVAFFWTGTSTVHLDNIALLPSGPCHAPTAARVDTVYADTVVLVWEDFSAAPAGYEVRYGTQADFASASTSLITLSGELAIAGLDASTEYYFWLRALCPDDSARWLYVGSAKTECGPARLPYVQRFDGSNFDTVRCWLSNAGNAATRRWFCLSDRLFMSADNGDSMLVATPLMLAPADELHVMFTVNNLIGNPIEVGVADDTLGSFVPLYTIHADDGSAHDFYTDQLPLSDTMRIAFRLKAPAVGSSSVMVDDFVVRHQRCHDPVGVVIDTVTYDMAALHIVDPAGTGFYRICVEHDGTTDTMELADTVATLTGLESGTTYHVSVAAICYDGSASQQVDASFRTYCPYISHIDLPYEQDFDQMVSDVMNAEVPCWTMMHFGSFHLLSQAVSDSSTTLAVTHYQSSSCTYIALPGIDEVGDLLLRFAAFNTIGTAMIEVGVMRLPDDDLTFVPVDTVYCTATNLWHSYEVLLTSYEGSDHWPALRITSTGATEVRIDDVWLGLVPPCSGAINNVEVSNVWSYSADIEWSVDLAYNQNATYTIHVETEDGQPAGDFFVDTTAYTICNLDELTSYRVWIEMFCGGDVQVVSDYVHFTTRCDNAQTIEQSAFTHDETPFMSSQQLPFNATKRYSATQQLFLADEFDNLPSVITGIDFRYCNDVLPFVVDNCSIYLSPYYSDTLTHWQTEGRQLVYSGPLLFEGSDWKTIYFTSPYDYDGVANLLVTVVADGKPVHDELTFAVYTVGYPVSQFYNSDIEPFNDTMSTWVGHTRADMHFHICPGEVPTCASPVLDEVVASSDFIRMAYDADGDMCQMSISQGWIWNGDVHAADNSGSFTFDGLEPVTNYIVGVRRMCPGMTSNWATRVIRTTQIECDMPTDPTAVEVGTDTAVVTFRANGADRWQLHLFNFRIDTVIDLTDTICRLADLVPDVTYHVAVRSLCGLNYGLRSDWSDTLDFTTAYCMPVASASVAADGPTSAVVRWSAPASADVDHYRVEYGLREFVRGEAIAAYNTADTMLRIDGLEPGIMYDFYVAAVCDDNSRSVWVFAGGVPPVGIDASAQQSELRLGLSPNPACGSVAVATEGPADITLYDLEGRTLLRSSTPGGTHTLDISSLAQGTYFVRATSSQSSTVGKLIVR